ncbi:MAG: hypothetical protein K2Y39_04750 [Candidatus Obscuribacterales bacterium]|nr:hypothetical protein [Candidatus Obscuribacterales bacterium]
MEAQLFKTNDNLRSGQPEMGYPAAFHADSTARETGKLFAPDANDRRQAEQLLGELTFFDSAEKQQPSLKELQLGESVNWRKYNDGSVEKEEAGEKTIWRQDGSVEKTYSDGSRCLWAKDGSVDISDKDQSYSASRASNGTWTYVNSEVDDFVPTTKAQSVYKENTDGTVDLSMRLVSEGRKISETSLGTLTPVKNPDGTSSLTSADGSMVITRFPDGKIVERQVGEDGKTERIYGADGTVILKTEVMVAGELSDQQITKAADGAISITSSTQDPHILRVDSDGNTFSVYRDKTKQWIKLDGNVLTESADGKKQSERIAIELRDGKTYYPDFSGGQGKITLPGGKSATIVDDGDDSLILEHEDGHREPLIMSDWSRSKMDELLHAYVMQNTLVVLPTAITEYRKNPAAPVLN